MATLKQKRAVKNLVENGGNVSKAMREAGYSKATAKNPKKLTERKDWQQLLEEYLPDDLLAKKHNELLEKKETLIRYNPKKKKYEAIRTEEIDSQAVGKGLDLAYKLKNKFAPTRIKFEDENDDLTTQEIEKQIAARKKKS